MGETKTVAKTKANHPWKGRQVFGKRIRNNLCMTAYRNRLKLEERGLAREHLGCGHGI